jgi:hypothetical protein
MKLIDETKGYSKIAARLFNNAGSIKKSVTVTVSEHSPESIQLTGKLSRTVGWRQVTVIPLRQNGRKDYIRFIKETTESEIWIKVSTAGGRSKIYVR